MDNLSNTQHKKDGHRQQNSFYHADNFQSRSHKLAAEAIEM